MKNMWENTSSNEKGRNDMDYLTGTKIEWRYKINEIVKRTPKIRSRNAKGMEYWNRNAKGTYINGSGTQKGLHYA